MGRSSQTGLRHREGMDSSGDTHYPGSDYTYDWAGTWPSGSGGVIVAILTPATSVLVVGQALQNTDNWATFLSTDNYTASAEGATVSSVVVNYIGDTPNATAAFMDRDRNHFSITVTDSLGNGRTFNTSARTVLYEAPATYGSLADQSFEESTGVQAYPTAGDFTGGGLEYTVNSITGVDIGLSTGVIEFNTNIMLLQTGTNVSVRAANSGGWATSDFLLTITERTPLPPGLNIENEGDGTSSVVTSADPVDILLVDQGDGTSTIGGEVAPANTNPPEIYLLPPDLEVGDNSSLGITQTGTPTWTGADSSSWDWYNAEGIMPGTTDADTISAGAPHSAAYYVVAQATNQYGTTIVQSNVVHATADGVLTVTPIVGDALEITATLQGACHYGWYEDGTVAFDPAALIRGDDTGQVAGGEAGMFTTVGTLDDATIDTAILVGGTTYVLALVLDINDAQGNEGYSNIATQDYTA